MNAVKSSAERVSRMRERQRAQGLRRLEIVPPPHPDDREAIKAYARALAQRRALMSKGQGGGA